MVFSKLLTQEGGLFAPIATVHTKKSQKKTINKLKKNGASELNVIEADTNDSTSLEKAFQGADKVILCTSAVPKIKLWSIVKILFFKIFSFIFKGPLPRPQFSFPKMGSPYEVDWLGAKNQIDAAKKAGVKHFIFLSSMGGTDPNNFLNTIGRVEGDDKSGNILLWKRKAEQYLMASGLKYTIIHPGGLTDKPGGKSEVLLGVDDNFLKETVRQIPRDDVATVCVKALTEEGAINRSIDIIAKESDAPTKDWKRFFATPGNCRY